MFTGSPIFTQFRTYSQRAGSGGSWFVLAPGLMLTLMAVAILIWPELLAYMVATVLLFVGLTLTLWGWSMRRNERRQQATYVRYDIF